MRITGRDLDTGRSSTLRLELADESVADEPLGASTLSTIGPLAVAQGLERELRGVPARLSGSMCVRIRLLEAPTRLGFCNRYVSSGAALDDEVGGVPGRAALDALGAFGLIDDFRFGRLHVTGVDVSTRVRRGLAQALMVGASAPRRVRPGQRIGVRLRLRHVRGGRQTIRLAVRVPRDTRPGRRTLSLRGTPDDDAAAVEDELVEDLGLLLGGGGSSNNGPRSIGELAQEIASIGRFDGVTGRVSGSSSGRRAVRRGGQLRISGRLQVPLRVVAR